MIPALFLGTIISALGVVALRYTSWPIVICVVALQAYVIFLWWREKGKKMGARVLLPSMVSFFVILGIDLFFSIVEHVAVAAVVLVGMGVFSAFSFHLWFERYKFAAEYQKRFISQWYGTVTSFMLFVWSAAGFSYFTWLRLPVWVSSFVLGGMTVAGLWLTLFGAWFVYGLGSSHKEGRAEIFWTLAVAGLIVFETVWALHFFPLGFFVNAFMITALYSVVQVIMRSMIARRGFARNEKLGLACTGVLTVLVAFFSRWI